MPRSRGQMTDLVHGVDYELVPYHRGTHEAFIVSSWCHGARQSLEALARYLRRPETRTVVAHTGTDPDALLGWACVSGGSVVWVYVRDLYGKLRRRGLGTALLAAAGAKLDEPTPCLYWSPAAAAIASNGQWRIFYAARAA